MPSRGLPWLALLAATSGVALLHACTPALETYPPWDGGGGGTTTTGSGGDGFLFDAGSSGPPAADAGGLCGNEVHKIVTDPPNVYFVLDRSGSMATPASGGTRYSVVQNAAAQLVKKLALLIKPGATVFPGNGDQCAPGLEVFAPTFDKPSAFASATGSVVPLGGTPTAATLSALLPKLTSLPGKTVVVLATDGGPNCNADAACDASGCMENIEGCSPGDTCCAQGQNCCAATGPAGPLNCVDHDPAVQAVAALAAAGIKVYVIGIPGSQYYEKVLADMALAGGASVPAYPFYYKVDDLATIYGVLASAAGSAIPCDFQLADAPADPNLTNVYFGTQVVAQDPVDGWTWSALDAISLHGKSCNALHAGQVSQVQIVSGCPTEAAK
jgi:hypothetical protein